MVCIFVTGRHNEKLEAEPKSSPTNQGNLGLSPAANGELDLHILKNVARVFSHLNKEIQKHSLAQASLATFYSDKGVAELPLKRVIIHFILK